MKYLGPILVLLLMALSVGRAHESRPGYLELREIVPDTYDVLWKVPARGDLRLSLDIQFPENTTTLLEPIGTFTEGAYVERFRIARAGGLQGETLRVEGLEATQTDSLIRITHLDGTTQTTRATPEQTEFTIEAVPGAWSVAGTYLVIGAEHILLGIDHLLFVLALLLLVKGWKKLLGAITAFTVAHSITLALATLGVVHVPGPPVEACIALSIVFVAAEIIHGRRGHPGWTARAPWVVAFAFGLMHGLGFAGALSEVGLPQQAIPLALLFFNVGVELGQIAFVLMVVMLIELFRRPTSSLPDWTHEVTPYAIGGVAAFWVVDRTIAFF